MIIPYGLVDSETVVHAMRPDYRVGMEHEQHQTLCGCGSYHRKIETDKASKLITCQACIDRLPTIEQFAVKG